MLHIAGVMARAGEIHETIFQNDVTRLEELLKNDRKLAEQPDKDNGDATPLCLAAELGRQSIVELLVKYGAEVDRARPGGDTPLFMACHAKNVAIVEFLITNKADVNKLDDYHRTPLHAAAGATYLGGINDLDKSTEADAIVQKLLAAGANPNVSETFFGFTPLHLALNSSYRTNAAKRLVEAGADVNARDKQQQTPLHVAAIGNVTNLLEFLVKHGSNIQAASDSLGTPLEAALHYGNETAAKTLLALGAARDIGLAAAMGDRAAIEEFLRKDARSVNQRDREEQTPLHWATYAGKIEIAEFLINHGGNVSARNREGKTPLHTAAYHKQEAIAELLVKHNADVNARDNDGWTPLLFATWTGSSSGSQKIATLLIEHGAKTAVTNRSGDTPQKFAKESGIKLGNNK